MDDVTSEFFRKMPETHTLYNVFAKCVRKKFSDVQIQIQKSQISFSNKHQFAFVWLPVRKIINRPDVYIIVSFGLSHRLVSPRIVEATEPYPNRWTHHLIIQSPNEIDAELMDWIKEVHDFAAIK